MHLIAWIKLLLINRRVHSAYQFAQIHAIIFAAIRLRITNFEAHWQVNKFLVKPSNSPQRVFRWEKFRRKRIEKKIS